MAPLSHWVGRVSRLSFSRHFYPKSNPGLNDSSMEVSDDKTNEKKVLGRFILVKH